MKKPVMLKDKQVILTDSDKIIAIYPYRDSDSTKVTLDTGTIHIVTCGVPKIERDLVITAYEVCAGFLQDHTGGIPSEPKMSPG